MNKLYQRINWQNYPSDSTPLNESNLNKMDAAVDGIDDRVVTLDVTKLPVTTANTMVKDVTFNETTGVFTITKLNGTKVTVNTALEKIATNFRYDHSTQKLILTLIDGTTQEVDLSALLTQYEFLNSSTIQFTIDSSGKVKASVVNGSITGDMLEPNYLANVTLQASKADTSAKNAKESEEKAAEYAESAKNSADSAEPVASTATGENPTIQDSTNTPIIYGKFKGYTEQMQYSGKNLCDNNNFTLTAGTGTAQTNYVFKKINIADKLKSDTTYILSADVKIIAGTPNEISIALLDEGLTNGSEIVSEGAITNNHVEVAIESGSNASDFYYLLIYAGAKGSTAGNSIEFSNVMFRESTTDATYEPYVGGTTSPNPDYPQEINGLAKGGAIEVKTCGKNLINPVPDSATNNGVTFTKQENKSYIVSGNIANATIPSHVTILSNKSLPIGEYILSGGTGANARVKLSISTEGKADKNYDVYEGDVEFSITNKTSTVTMVLVLDTGATVTSQIFKPMIRPAEIADDTYEPYTETTAAIPTDAPLYEGDYLEVYADGSGKEYHKMAEVVLDETHSYVVSESADYTGDTIYFGYAENIELYKENGIIKCDKLTERRGLYGADAEGMLYEGSVGYRSIRFRIKKSRLVSEDVAGLKAWLAENPLHVVIELAEPTETPLTAEQVEQFKKLYSFEPVTNVLCDGEVEMRYYKANVNGETVGMLQEQTKDFAKKTIYGDTTINVGRKEGSIVGDCSTAIGAGTTASGYASLAEGFYTTAENTAAHAEGSSTKASALNSHAEGNSTNALESNSHAEGYKTIASGLDSHAEGNTTTASGEDSHAEGYKTIASQKYSHAEGNTTTASGLQSHAEGNTTTASGLQSHAEGNNSKAIGAGSHAEGYMTEAKGNNSHAEGDSTTANKINSHAEGRYSTADGDCSHAEGYKTNSSGLYSHSEGNSTTASGTSSHSEGYFTTASGLYSHAEGNTTKASGNLSHAEGDETIASGVDSHAEGAGTVASGDLSHSEGYFTTALTNQHAQGHYNNTNTATANSVEGTSTGTAFVIGNGTSSSVSNALRVTGDGYIYATNANVQTGADYAEYFEWADGNPNKEDRVGYFVTFDEDNPTKIRIANEGDYILGIVSGMPSVIGNGDECWKQRYVLDEFGRYIEETFEYETKETDAETGEEIKVIKIGTKWKENPEYNHSKAYIPRKERAEWSAIGMIGVLSVYDDGNCQAGGYCRVINGGISTVAERGSDTYRVLERITDNIIKIVLK